MKPAMDMVFEAEKKLAEAGTHAAELLTEVANTARAKAADAKLATDECIANTAEAVRKHPLTAIGITFGAGIGAGLLAGWLLRRR